MENVKTEKRDDLWLPFDALAAPNCRQTSELWFEKTASDICSDFDFYRAFIYKVINEHFCPAYPEWASFVVAGSVVSALSNGRLIIPRNDKKLCESLEPHIWEALWYISRENKDKLNNDLLGFILRLFLPRERRDEDDNLYKTSNFCEIWPTLCCRSDYEIATTIRLSAYCKGRNVFERLQQDFKDGIDKIAEQFPVMRRIVSEHLRRILLYRHQY